MKKKDIKLLSEAIEKNFFETYNKIKRLDEGAINETPWNGDPNSSWVPGDDDVDIELEDFNMQVSIGEQTAEYPMDSIHLSAYGGNGRTGRDSLGWVSHTELSSLVGERAAEYLPLAKQILNLNGGQSFKISGKELHNNPKTKDIANIIFDLLGEHVKDEDRIEWDTPHEPDYD